MDTSIEINIESDETVSYASYQNSIPLIRSISLKNNSEYPIEEIEVVVKAEPDFLEVIQFNFAKLDVGESRRIADVPLRFRHKYLAELNEAELGRIIVNVRCRGNSAAVVDKPVHVLAYEQWGGTRSIPELLAAFSVPNNPHVERIIAEAAELLGASGRGNFMNAYGSKNREVVWSQVSAIYSAIARRGLQYSMPPASFATNGQKIRLPDRVFETGLGTCLDLTMLIVSCLEQVGLNPVVLVKEGHSWVGCWYINTSFPTSIVDDALSVRKRLENGEMFAFETTGLGHRPVMSLRRAQEVGLNQLIDPNGFKKFLYAIDIRQTRLQQIRPLPSRDAVPLVERQIGDLAIPIETSPSMPPLVTEAILLDEDPVAETPEGRLARWQSKLLDLTLRNRLLNFKESRVMIPLRVPNPSSLEDALSDGKKWKFRAKPKIMEGSDPRSRSRAIDQSGEDPEKIMAQEAMAAHELLVPIDKDKLDKSLYEVFLAVRNNLEESGANTLFLAIGFLEWAEDDEAEKTYKAPVLMVPVKMDRANARSGFWIERHDDETMVNPTLLQMLRQNHNLVLQKLEPPPTDEKGVDVSKIMAIFRHAVRDLKRWRVIDETFLGVFSFHKFVMYSDLKNRAEQMKQSRVVHHLIEKPREPLGTDDISEYRDIDDTHSPGQLLAPLVADSSQLNALRRADQGHSFVIEGPPGTGKSQTITNLIAHFLGQGKKVLFVSEKIAALTVVEKRLSQIGLADFCLQLHSSKAVKAEVLDQLHSTLSVARQHSPAEWKIELERLNSLRNDLNSLVRALHREHPNGLTVRSALDVAIRYETFPETPVELPSVDALDRAGLAKLRQLADAMQTALAVIGNPATHALKAINQRDFSNAWEQKLLSACDQMQHACDRLEGACRLLANPLGLPLERASLKLLSDTVALSEVLLRATTIPQGLATRANDESSRKIIDQLRAHGEVRSKTWLTLKSEYKPEIEKIRGLELQSRWNSAETQWVIPKWFAQRQITRELSKYRIDGERPNNADVSDLARIITKLNTEDQAIHALSNDCTALLGAEFKGKNTDWPALKRMEEWSQKLSATLSQFASADDLTTYEQLSSRVMQFLGPHRQLLAPNGQLATRLVEFRDAYVTFTQAIEQVRQLIGNQEFGSPTEDTLGIAGHLRSVTNGWQSNKAWLRAWCHWRAKRAEGLASGLGKIVKVLEQGQVEAGQFRKFVDYCYQLWWVKNTMDREDALKNFNGAEHERKIREFRECDAQYEKLTEKTIYARLASAISTHTTTPAGAAGPEIALLTREKQKKTRHIPIRQLVRGMPNLLPTLKPCLLMSPISVAQYLGTEHQMFDVVLFDEASQIPVWDAVGVIARAGQVIVVGDPKQLPPTNFFERGESDDDTPAQEQEDAAPKDMESILDECMASRMSTLMLNCHYRSKHESLIAFSNIRYYGSNLITFPSPVTKDTAVKYQDIGGVYDRGGARTNRNEADAIVKRIVEHFTQEDAEARALTMGVVTFNAQQMRLIDQLLNEELAKNPVLEGRIAEHGAERLFIKNLESVQGDERDIVLFSITFGKDAAGKTTMNFGPINQTGGHRRLNVAVTRARRAIEIFASIRPEDIDLSKTKSQGVADLKAYLDYSLRGPVALLEESLPTGREPDSAFEEDVIRVLRGDGWTVHPQVGCSGFRVDIGIVDKNAPGVYLIGVECDGATYHGMASARDRDRLRQSILESLNWKITRVWSTDWWTNKKAAAEKLLLAVRNAQSESDKKTTRPL